MSVFVNCPFDDAYKPMFEAIVFAVFDCGYRPRCALEAYDAGEARIEKIVALVRNCRLGVHDISRTELNAASLPRFNMPFELGLFLGAKRFGNAVQRRKICLVLDREPYRYQAFLSDIAGQDIAAHGGEPARAIGAVRDWLAAGQRRRPPPGGAEIVRRFAEFSAALPGILACCTAPNPGIASDASPPALRRPSRPRYPLRRDQYRWWQRRMAV